MMIRDLEFCEIPLPTISILQRPSDIGVKHSEFQDDIVRYVWLPGLRFVVVELNIDLVAYIIHPFVVRWYNVTPLLAQITTGQYLSFLPACA